MKMHAISASMGSWDLFNFLNTRNMCWLVFGVVSSRGLGRRAEISFDFSQSGSPVSGVPFSLFCHVFYLLYFTYQRIDSSKEAHTRSFGTDDRVSRHETSGNRLIENVTIFAIFSSFFPCWLLRRLPHSFPTLFRKEQRMLFSGITWVFSKFDKFSFPFCSVSTNIIGSVVYVSTELFLSQLIEIYCHQGEEKLHFSCCW